MKKLKVFGHFKRVGKWSVLLTSFVLLASTFGSPVESTRAAQTNNILLPIVIKGVPPNVEQSRFGIQMYFDTGNTVNNHYYDAIVDSGTSWIRANLEWNRIEATDLDPSGYDWEWADYAAGAARDGRYNQVLTLIHAPDWFSGGKDGPPDDGQSVDDIAEFMAAVAERYDGDGYQDGYGTPIVNHFELYNEPDHKDRWGNKGAEYANMLSVVYPAIKAANPNAKVLLGGVAMDGFTDEQDGDPDPPFMGDHVRSFVDDVLAAGGGQHIDIMAIHQYPPFIKQWNPSGIGVGLVDKVAATREIMRQHEISKPIMITESGSHSNPHGDNPDGWHTEEIQSQYLVELFTQAHAADVETLMWFTMYDGIDINNNGQASGLVKEPTSPGAAPYRKKSLTAFTTITSMLNSAQFQRTLPAGETGNNTLMEVHQFLDTATGKTIYVAWMNPVDSSEQVALSVPGSQATMTDIYGSVVGTVADAADGAADGRVSVTVSGQPVYIQID